MKIHLALLLLLCSISLFSQKQLKPIAADIQNAKDLGTIFHETQLFENLVSSSEDFEKLKDAVTDASILKINYSLLHQAIRKNSKAISLAIPNYQNENLVVDLIKVNLFSEGFNFIKSSTNKPFQPTPGVHYRGILRGNNNSIVTISIFKDEIIGLIADDRGNHVIGKLEGHHEEHILYNDKNLSRGSEFICASNDDDFIQNNRIDEAVQNRAPGDCVRIYVETDYDVYQNKGTGTSSFVTGFFNQCAAMYANESVNIALSQVFIWDTTSPYNGSSSSDFLNGFQSYRNSFFGDLGHLVNLRNIGGVAAGFNGICANNLDNSMCYSGINPSFATIPTYSWTVDIFCHEMGHLMGSPHTHGCYWNGNNTAIDGCYTTEGSCTQPAVPAGGGTIMSYCHLESVGKNFNLGFGQQPGDVIRNTIANANCLPDNCNIEPSCTDGFQNGDETGVDCGGSSCPACPTCTDGIQNQDEEGIDCGGRNCPWCPCAENQLVLTITLDQYPEETTWTLTDDQGNTIDTGGPFGGEADNSTIQDPICVPFGCYTFTISDSYGDGICCQYGNGAYTLTDADGNTLATGGDFGGSEATNFCLEDDCPDCPTCTDGIQNGDETDIDCGGSTCPACPTCSDGIQNQDETGVDCGGSICSACPTCTDGIQNGDETDIDCGGSSCPACPGCTDGIQNGDETGVDCGGATCPSCPTCSDGIQNGDETGIDCGGSTCPACPVATCTTITISITMDNYPEDITWDIQDANGNVWDSGGVYNVADGTTLTGDRCLEAGCWTFNIYDSYGDGLCCTQGNGSYSIVDEDGNTLASGGEFTSTEATTFCFEAATCIPDLLLSANESGTTADYEVDNTITSSCLIDGNAIIKYQAGSAVNLENNFEVQLGSEFLGIIDICTPSALNSSTTKSLEKETSNDLQIKVRGQEDIRNLYYELKSDSPISISIYDHKGAVISQIFNNHLAKKGRYKIAIDQMDLPPGIYLFKIESNDQLESRKILVD